MIHSSYLFDQRMTLKMIGMNYHNQTPFEDPIKGDFLKSVLRKKGLGLTLECSIRRGLHFFHQGPGGDYGKLDL